MFESEASMIKPAIRWMKALQLSVKSEFITPWGICDLVGAAFKKASVNHRLKLGQRQPVGSLIRSNLLFRIPEADTQESKTIRRLAQECAPTIPEEVVVEHTQQLIADGFVVRLSRDRLQRLNGWVPLHKRLIAVELKLNRVEEAIYQARNNLIFADESYIGLPKDLAVRVAAKKTRWSSLLDGGVGVLAVTSRGCEILRPSRHYYSAPDPVIQFYCVEKFWRNHPKCS